MLSSLRSSVRVIDPAGRMCLEGRKRNVCECEKNRESRVYIFQRSGNVRRSGRSGGEEEEEAGGEYDEETGGGRGGEDE